MQLFWGRYNNILNDGHENFHVQSQVAISKNKPFWKKLANYILQSSEWENVYCFKIAKTFQGMWNIFQTLQLAYRVEKLWKESQNVLKSSEYFETFLAKVVHLWNKTKTVNIIFAKQFYDEQNLICYIKLRYARGIFWEYFVN